MAKSFAELKKQRSAHLAALTTKINDVAGGKFADDDNRFWQPTVDKEGNGYAVIRFLPEIEGEDVPFVRIWNHGFQGPGGWYIENCLTTIGKDDPVAEYNNLLWNSTTDDKSPARKQARDQKRKLNFISNILVIEDGAKPENNGKVFLYKYGKKIFDKIKEKMEPEFKDEAAINPFDLWEGANFKLKIRKVEGYRNYDRSEFELENKAGYPIAENDKQIEAIWKQAYPLAPFVAPDQFKPYAELKAKMIKVLGMDPFADKNAEPEPEREAPRQRSKPATTAASSNVEDDDIPFDPTGDEGDDDMAFFKNLVDK
jgi:hypothetical protein